MLYCVLSKIHEVHGTLNCKKKKNHLQNNFFFSKRMIKLNFMRLVVIVYNVALYFYRCEVPGCDNPNPANQIYSPEWLRFTTPHRQETGQPLKCKRYTRKLSLGNSSSQCVSGEFDQDVEEWCDGNWVFENRENTVGTEVCVLCIHIFIMCQMTPWWTLFII